MKHKPINGEQTHLRKAAKKLKATCNELERLAIKRGRFTDNLLYFRDNPAIETRVEVKE
jgi:hypothetical protein